MKLRKVDGPESELVCPKCKSSLGGASHEEDLSLRPDDLSVCVYCCQLMQFTETMGLKALSEADMKKLPEKIQREMKLAIAHIHIIHALSPN